MNTNDLLNLHEELFQFLMKYKASKPNFTFAIRVNDDSNGRFRSGMWFHGNDNYIFIGLTDRGDRLKKRRMSGFPPMHRGPCRTFLKNTLFGPAAVLHATPIQDGIHLDAAGP
jgi:hypothetical protein